MGNRNVPDHLLRHVQLCWTVSLSLLTVDQFADGDKVH